MFTDKGSEAIVKTRMITFIKAKLNKSDDQKNIDKYRVAANITELHIMSKLIFLGGIIILRNIFISTNINYREALLSKT